ncbi:MAG: radical SAM family heme chaperone HemW [Treponema sp.]|nr:radical SAM family heme chaperone HemW [Treponema sp.]
MNTASIYIHVPFCASLCDYCDFFSVPIHAGDVNRADRFVDSVLVDVENQLALFGVRNVPTVYIGGGTPSVLGAASIKRLLSGLKNLFTPLVTKPAEFTVEANPESMDQAFLQVCSDGGVNRISLGIQTFHEASRRQVGRVGSSELLSQRLSLVNKYFPGAFSADLITGLPFQTQAVLSNDIERLLEFQPAHVSLYSLILEPETALGKRIHNNPTEDEADNLWIAGRDMLEKAGLEQYEVSNFALPGKECSHNIRYWRMESWLGIGPAASGTIINEGEKGRLIGRRFTYPRDIDSYLSTPAQSEELSTSDLMQESLLMGFRYRGGPDPHIFRKRFDRDIADCIPDTIARWRKKGFFETEGSTAPSRKGLLFLNSFLRDAFAEMETNP